MYINEVIREIILRNKDDIDENNLDIVFYNVMTLFTAEVVIALIKLFRKTDLNVKACEPGTQILFKIFEDYSETFEVVIDRIAKLHIKRIILTNKKDNAEYFVIDIKDDKSISITYHYNLVNETVNYKNIKHFLDDIDDYFCNIN